MSSSKSPHTAFKRDNTERVFNLIRRVGSRSMAGVCTNLGLSLHVVRNALIQLVDKGLLKKRKGFRGHVYDLTKKGKEHALKKRT